MVTPRTGRPRARPTGSTKRFFNYRYFDLAVAVRLLEECDGLYDDNRFPTRPQKALFLARMSVERRIIVKMDDDYGVILDDGIRRRGGGEIQSPRVIEGALTSSAENLAKGLVRRLKELPEHDPDGHNWLEDSARVVRQYVLAEKPTVESFELQSQIEQLGIRPAMELLWKIFAAIEYEAKSFECLKAGRPI